MKTIHLIISGRVQGVFFRATAKKMADQFGIKGWVRNTAEGNVETMASGKKNALEEFIQWCHQEPANAKVTQVEISECSFQDFPDFRTTH